MCDHHEQLPLENMFNRRAALAGLSSLAVLGGLTACTPGSAGDTENVAGTSSNTSNLEQLPAGLEVIFLGTQGGPPVETSRAGIATAIRVDGSIYVVDCGRAATTQYAKAGLKFKSLKAIFLTHLHADHLADYYNFLLLAGSVPNSQGDSLQGRINVYGPGPAGGLPPKFGGGEAPTIAPEEPTPGISALTNKCHEAFAYSHNVFLRDSGIRDVRSIATISEIALPDIAASFANTSPATEPFLVMEDENVRVTATLVPHGPVFPAFAFRFDTKYGSVTFSGDTTYSDNLNSLASGSDMLVHEAINVRGANHLTPALLDHLLHSHVEVQHVGKIAEKAGASKLVLSHIDDLAKPLDTSEWKRWAKDGYSGEVVIAEDLQRLSVEKAT